MKRDVRIGIVGCGHLGTIHARLVNQTSGAQLAGVFDLDPVRRNVLSDYYSLPVFESLQQLAQAADACCIVTPSITHADVAEVCLAEGVHLFIEKPVASSRNDAERIRKGVPADCVVQVGHVERFNPAFRFVESLQPRSLFIEAHRLAPFSNRATDVAVVLDLMIHDIDLVVTLNGGVLPTEVRASGTAVFSNEVDIANARLQFATGCVANLTASRISLSGMRKMRLFAPQTYLSIDFAEPSVDVYELNKPDLPDWEKGRERDSLSTDQNVLPNLPVQHHRPPLDSRNAIADELQSFVDAIRFGTEIPVTLEESIRNVAVAEMILSEIVQTVPGTGRPTA